MSFDHRFYLYFSESNLSETDEKGEECDQDDGSVDSGGEGTLVCDGKVCIEVVGSTQSSDIILKTMDLRDLEYK